MWYLTIYYLWPEPLTVRFSSIGDAIRCAAGLYELYGDIINTIKLKRVSAC